MTNYYKRYIYKNGVKLGPYYYSNKKVNGKVISTYLGTKEPTRFNFKVNPVNKKIVIVVLSVVSVALLIYIAMNIGLFGTGQSIVDSGTTGIIGSVPGEEINLSNVTNVGELGVDKMKILDEVPEILTEQGQATINSQVEWSKEVKLKKDGPTKVQVPSQATDIVVFSVDDAGNKQEVSDSNVGVTAQASSEIVLDEGEPAIVKFFKKIFNFLTGNVVTVSEIGGVKEVVINENKDKYEVDYKTPGPTVVEEETDNGKKVTVNNPQGLQYKNVVVYTNIESLGISDASLIIIYSVNQDEYVSYTNIDDTNSDGVLDYLEWVSPSADNQTYEIIVITRAEHLDKDRVFISNIYDKVVTLDDIFTEEIPNGDYVRVTFEKNLTFENDITVFPKIGSGNPRIEVYEKDGNEIIASFENLIDNEYNKVLLTNLVGEQDTYDLKIVGGSVFFDYIVDPYASPSPPSGGSLLRSQRCLMENSSLTSFTYNLNCQGVYPGVCGSATDRIGCNDGVFVEQLVNISNNRYSGIFTNISNSSITNCASISQVFFCYEWWRSGSGTVSNCVVQVDANGGASYNSVSTTCPGTSSNPVVTCNDVTSLEPWTCGVFFGPGATGALARSQIFKTSGNQNRYLRTDSFYFNVSYTLTNQPPSISLVQQPLSDSPLEAGVRNVVFEVRVTDPDGMGDIDRTSVTADFSKAGEPMRSGSCVWQSDLINGITSIYSCTVGMQYYDAAGAWTMTIKAKDLSGAQATDSSGTFTYQSLKAMTIISPVGALSWPTLNPGSSTPVSSNNHPNVIKNTGNYAGPILITAKDLIGVSNPIYTIPVSNFRAGPTSGLECTATQLQNSVSVSIASSNLPRGSGATTSIYYCLTSVPLVSSQQYSATGANSWRIEI